jgi:hypothetical protein
MMATEHHAMSSRAIAGQAPVAIEPANKETRAIYVQEEDHEVIHHYHGHRKDAFSAIY